MWSWFRNLRDFVLFCGSCSAVKDDLTKKKTSFEKIVIRYLQYVVFFSNNWPQDELEKKFLEYLKVVFQLQNILQITLRIE